MAGGHWNINPLHCFRRQVREDASLDRETRFHVLLWLRENIARYAPDDITQQTLLRQAGEQYLETRRINLAIATVGIGSLEYARLIGLRCKINADLVKTLRLCGLSTKHKAAMKGKGKGSVFPPARGREKSETEAEKVA